MKLPLLVCVLMQLACSTANDDPVFKTMEDRAARVTIIRDKWGIPHIYGKSDADAVFGLMYAQCEENFERVERNYIQRLGRLAEVEGERYLYQDLQMRLIYDTAEAILDYQNSPAWLKELLHAFADGINYFLVKNPQVRPKLLTHFEPWYSLMFTDGGYTATQTGGAELSDLKNMYGPGSPAPGVQNTRFVHGSDPDGSNAFAIGPSKSASGKALLYINPHVNFYFRTEAHMVSEQGLNAYGAVTWGQFFVFQGFNEFCGWMHTSSLADASDLYEESVVSRNGGLYYHYNDSLRKITSRQHVFTIAPSAPLRTGPSAGLRKGPSAGLRKGPSAGLRKGPSPGLRADPSTSTRSVPITAFYTHHGPVVGKRKDKWLSLREENRTLNGLIQSWQRTKAKNFDEFKQSMKLRGNNSCNTMYADRNGTIAYWHGNFIPVRDSSFNYTMPLDGNNPATEWKGVHDIDDLVYLRNPVSGWLQNCNSGPFLLTDEPGLDPRKYPTYMAPDGENFRSLRARQLLGKKEKFTLDDLIATGYDRYLAIFDSVLPPLLHSFDELKTTDSMYMILREPVQVLKNWDRYAGVSTVALSLGAEWVYKLWDQNYSLTTMEEGSDQVTLFSSFVRKTSSRQLLNMLREVVRDYERIYGTWKIPWGELVRFQRTTGDIHPKFDDNKESVPVGLASALFGCLPAYESVWAKTYRSYGVAGNSFVAAVEFGDRVKAKSVVTAGQSFQPGSKNFKDQVPFFLEGRLKDVLFYKEDVLKNSSKKYHP